MYWGRTAFPAAPGNDQKTRRGYSGKPPYPLLVFLCGRKPRKKHPRDQGVRHDISVLFMHIVTWNPARVIHICISCADKKCLWERCATPGHPILRIRDAPWEGVPSRGIAGWVSMLRKWGGDSKKLQTQKKAGGITPKGHAFGGGTMAENPGARTPGNLRFVPTGRAWATSPRYRLSIHWFAARPACGFPWLRCRGSHARENRQSPQSRMDRGLQDPYRIM